MTKISFNAQALGIAHHYHGCDVGHPGTFCPLVPVVSQNTSVEALFEVLGLLHIKGLPPSQRNGPTEDLDP